MSASKPLLGRGRVGSKHAHLTLRLLSRRSSEQISTTAPNRSNRFRLKSSSRIFGQTWPIAGWPSSPAAPGGGDA